MPCFIIDNPTQHRSNNPSNKPNLSEAEDRTKIPNAKVASGQRNNRGDPATVKKAIDKNENIDHIKA